MLSLCVNHSLIFLFCPNSEKSLFVVSLNTLTKGPVDQSDKAILVPFLKSTENSFKAMQKRELLLTLPLLYYRIWN